MGKSISKSSYVNEAGETHHISRHDVRGDHRRFEQRKLKSSLQGWDHVDGGARTQEEWAEYAGSR